MRPIFLFLLTQIFSSSVSTPSGPRQKPGVRSLAFYTRMRKEHWLRDKFDEGRIVLLEDESMWEVHPADRLTVERWLRISTIAVEHTQEEGYPYRLTNSTERETARANYLGDFAPPVPQVA